MIRKGSTRAGLAAVTFLAAAATAYAAGAAKSEAPAPEAHHAAMAAGSMSGAKAPDFTLQDLDGKTYRLSELVADGKTVVLEWFNPDCPFVKKHHEKNKTMEATSKAAGADVVWLAVNSGAPGKQGAGVDRNRKAREDYGIAYPILLDESGVVGRAYGAKTTPAMYVIHDGAIVYAGAIDDNATPGTLGETNYVSDALAAVKAGKPVAVAETKSYGCSVKYGADVP